MFLKLDSITDVFLGISGKFSANFPNTYIAVKT